MGYAVGKLYVAGGDGGAVVGSVVGRSAEFRAIDAFINSATTSPAALVIEGEAGIGKTTLWLAAIEEARRRGYRILSAAVGQAESVLAYAAVADLFDDIDQSEIEELPEVQRFALDRVLLRSNGEGPATDQRVVAAALVTLVESSARGAPVLVAIDDAQWLDSCSQAVVAFAARRFKGQVGVLFTERSEQDFGDSTALLQLTRPDAVERIRIGPLSLGALHTLISRRLGRNLSRPTLVRIAEASGGNPFYALELARAVGPRSNSAATLLPDSLAELMRTRLRRLQRDAQDVLLATACVADPTVELLAEATNRSVDEVLDLLDEAETNGIVAIDGHRVRFTHPLLARSVYTDASSARRRAMHRRLAEALAVPELKARHMALAASRADPDTLRALDAAADAARARGAPAAAAELVELAMNLGGDTPSRRVRAAEHHFKAGDAERANALLEQIIGDLRPGLLRSIALNLSAGMRIFDDRFVEAARLLERALDDAKGNQAVLIHTLMVLAFCQGMTGDFDESLENALKAVTLADELGVPALSSQALAMWTNVQFLYGQGIDEDSLARALELEDSDVDVPVTFRASSVKGLLLAWTGKLDQARNKMSEVRQYCIERGAENDMMAVAGYGTLIEMWRGNYAEATLLAEETMERALQVGGSCAIALTVRAAVSAYTGREAEARTDAHRAIEVAEQCGSHRLAEWPMMTLGFLDVSHGNYAEALAVMQPLVDGHDSIPGSEIMDAAFIPDAVEAMVGLGRLADAEPLIKKLETNGRMLDRAWMLAVSARCRAMLTAAEGDVEAAEAVARQALTEHSRLQMPFERARTQLLIAQLLRRQRKREAAVATMNEALDAFNALGTPLWVERTRAELARITAAPDRDQPLTPTERRVAELAVSGMTNRDVAAALFVSPKTVEAHLARIYRKLDIRTRAELGRIFR